MLDAANDRPAPDTSSERHALSPDCVTSSQEQAGGVEQFVNRHTTDADCASHLDAEGLSCTVCGVSWSDGCSFCGGRAFHIGNCVDSDGHEPAAALHVLSITSEHQDQYGWTYSVSYSLDGETVRLTEFARNGKHDEWAVVGGDVLSERDWRHGEITELIEQEAEGKAASELHAANIRRASAWLAFREGGEEDADAMLPRTVEIPMLTLREIGDLYWSEQAALVGGGR